MVSLYGDSLRYTYTYTAFIDPGYMGQQLYQSVFEEQRQDEEIPVDRVSLSWEYVLRLQITSQQQQQQRAQQRKS